MLRLMILQPIAGEIELIHNAIKNSGREIVLSLSPDQLHV